MMKQLIQTKCPALVLFVYAFTLMTGCTDRAGTSPDGYQLNNPVTMRLGKVLNEVSGIFYIAEDSSLAAISDNEEKIIHIQLKNKKLKDVTSKVVAPQSDLEDIVMVDGMYYILLSRGVIKAVPPGAQDSSEVLTFELPVEGPNDFETLYHDADQDALIMLCKSCAREKGENFRSAFKFDLRTRQFDSTAFFEIPSKEVEDFLKDKDVKFNPSAAALHPITKQLYILSSAGNLLVITDRQGKFIEAYKLNPDKYPQAEGIAFAPNGNMFISNEGKLGVPTLLFFPYRPAGKKTKSK